MRLTPLVRALAKMSKTVSAAPYNASWHQTMLRIRDPAKSLPFYQDVLGFTLLHKYTFDDFSLYFLATVPEGEWTLTPGTKEAEAKLWTMPYTCVELTHNHATEKDPNFRVNNGNEEPHRGFGHLAVFTNDVYTTCDQLEKKGVTFKKKPDEGRMKGLAFAYDPDGYWIEIIKREPPKPVDRFTFSQTMLRVKDPKKSIKFYSDYLGMTLLNERHFPKDKGDFSLYFLASLPEGTQVPEDITSEEARQYIKGLDCPVLELTHNHGTEDDADFSYHNGNTEPKGFGHVGFLVDNLESACDDLIAKGVDFKKKPQDGKMRGIAFAYDPDGYWVELIQRGVSF